MRKDNGGENMDEIDDIVLLPGQAYLVPAEVQGYKISGDLTLYKGSAATTVNTN